MPLGLITGASKGFGRAVARELAAQGWDLVVDARHAADLTTAFAGCPAVTTIAGDVTDPLHRDALAATVGDRPLDLLVNNASLLGPSPQPDLASYPLEELRRVYETNLVAPLALVQLLLPALHRAPGTVVNVTSDASVEAYAGWGGYGSSKAALDHLSAVLAEEQRDLRIYAFDPGDMRTEMHQDAFPGEDISDRPEPEAVVPALLRLLEHRPPSGRVRAAALLAPVGAC
ncbi:MAG TPA: SDR family NAD(P)-dependent oxidoreductase [Mycobacteriales bacterium]|nr:SDR family NAD(P)-dependent oxidoreductase [Mycobacteriales bacterium]